MKFCDIPKLCQFEPARTVVATFGMLATRKGCQSSACRASFQQSAVVFKATALLPPSDRGRGGLSPPPCPLRCTRTAESGRRHEPDDRSLLTSDVRWDRVRAPLRGGRPRSRAGGVHGRRPWSMRIRGGLARARTSKLHCSTATSRGDAMLTNATFFTWGALTSNSSKSSSSAY